jgi:transcriptional regulator with XRE-family HTH domain
MSKEMDQTLGEKILKAIKDKGLVQSKIADKMKVSRQIINQIDRRKTFDLEFLQKLKEATDLDFTGYLYPQGSATQDLKVTDLVEMSLAIKLKSTPEQISRMGELLTNLRKEALRMGFTIM